MRQTGRYSALLPYILLLLHLWAAASSERACEVVTHFPTLARGLSWETHHTVVFWLAISMFCRHTTISVYPIVECRPRMHFRFHCTVPFLMHFYKKGGWFFNILLAAGFTTDNNCQQALRHERASISPLPVLRHCSASYNRVSYDFSQHASTGKEIICSGM